jgi:hypothetical protein
MRPVVATFANEHGDVVVSTDMAAGVSECFLQKPKQTSLWRQVTQPGFYELERFWVEHLRGVTHVDLPEIGVEVRCTSEVVGWRLR